MITPGLLPEDGGRRSSPLRWILALLALGFLTAVGVLAIQIVKLKRERDAAQSRVEELLAEIRKPRPAPVPREDTPAASLRLEELEARVARLEAARPAEPPLPPAPIPPGVRDEPAAPARRAESESMLYVYVSVGFARQGFLREAVRSLGEALRLDPSAFWRVNPRALVESEEEYRKLLADLERRVREDPLDAEARTVLAYLYYHQGETGRAKVLLLEVVAAHPEPGGVARRLLEKLEE